MLKSAIKSYCFVSPDFMSRPFFFACWYVTRWGKFGRVFCKQTSVGAACRFQNECNKVEIALRVVQFWSEIKLVITNRTPASRSWHCVITRLILDQISSTQCNYHYFLLPKKFSGLIVNMSSQMYIIDLHSSNICDFPLNRYYSQSSMHLLICPLGRLY